MTQSALFSFQVALARYVARNNINHLKRYSIERVYREKKLHGLHPRELVECAFDIITSHASSTYVKLVLENPFIFLLIKTWACRGLQYHICYLGLRAVPPKNVLGVDWKYF